MLVAPRVSECFGLPWSALVCLGLLESALDAAGLAAAGLAAAGLVPLQCRMGKKGRKGLLT